MPLGNDLRFAFRQLRKSPGFTGIVLATLGLCIGANTAIYSVLDAVLLRSAPYPEPERLALVVTNWRAQNGRQGVQASQNAARFEGVRDQATGLDTAAYSGTNGANFSSNGHLEHIRQQRVTTGYFRVLGVAPRMGREFTREEDVPGGPAVAVLSHDFWQRIFQGDTGAIGRTINLRGEPYTVIGIMPKDFRATAPVDVWTPLRPSRTGEGGGSNYGMVARVKPGTGWNAAAEQLRAISPGLFAGAGERDVALEQGIVPLQSGLTQNVRSELLITGAAVLIVLLIGCVNIAGLLLARSSTRSREIATRLALGGGRAAIVRQLLVESLLLALGGGVLGAGIGMLSLGWLKRLGAESFESWYPITIDARVLAAMMGVALLTSILFGLLPAVSSSRLDIRSVLVEGGRGVVGGRRHWMRNALVICEVALSLVLLVGAGLLVRTLTYLNGLNPGFDPHNVLTASASLQDARYKTSEAVNRLFTQSLDRIRRIPGVESAAVALTLPYERPLNDGFRLLEGSDTQRHSVETVYTTPGHFETLRIPLIAGRTFRDTDTADAPKVVVVSQAFVNRYLKGENPLGRHLAGPREIVGVVGDVQQHSGLGNFGPISLDPTVYMPVAQTSDGMLQVVHTWFAPKWLIRGGGPVGALSAQVQAAVAAADPLLPIAKFQTFDDLQIRITQDQRYHAALFSIIAGLALLLAAIGLYGLISQSITQRTHELGVRLALGATARQAMANAMRPGILLAAGGVAAGCGLSFLAVRLMTSLLWGVRPNDTVTFVATAAILMLVAAIASLVPALRILRLDPARTLRSE